MAPLDELVDAAEHPVFVIDPAADRIHDANRAACEFLGYERDELLATPISAVHPAEMPQLAAWAATVRRDGHGWSGVFTCRTKSGEFIPTEMEAFAPDARGLVFVLVRSRTGHRRVER